MAFPPLPQVTIDYFWQMEFQNAGIAIDTLPRAESIALQPIHPDYFKVQTAQWITLWVILLITAGLVYFFNPAMQQPLWAALLFGGLIFFALLHYFLMSRSFKYKAFAVREHDIIYRTGWLIQSTRTCPFNRIQHCSVEAGIYERKYGLAKLSLFTAGGQEADMRIPGLTAENAATLRELVIKKSGAYAKPA